MAESCNYLTAFSHWPVAFKNSCPKKQVLSVQYTAIILRHLQLICIEKSFQPNRDLQAHEVWTTQVCQNLKTKWVDTTMLFYNSSLNLQWSVAKPNPEVSGCCIIELFINFLPPYCSLLVMTTCTLVDGHQCFRISASTFTCTH